MFLHIIQTMHIAHEIKVIWMAMVPVIELRGAIPYGIIRQLHPWFVFLLAWIGSTLIIAPVYYLFTPCMDLLERTPSIGPIFRRFRERIVRKGNKLGRVEFVGLLLFVGVPLPGTGAWTGAMIASVMKMSFRSSFVAITLGNIMAGLITLFIFYIGHGTYQQIISP